jgi:hypothetical protein
MMLHNPSKAFTNSLEKVGRNKRSAVQAIALDSVGLDSVGLDSVGLDSVRLDSVRLDSVGLPELRFACSGLRQFSEYWDVGTATVIREEDPR